MVELIENQVEAEQEEVTIEELKKKAKNFESEVKEVKETGDLVFSEESEKDLSEITNKKNEEVDKLKAVEEAVEEKQEAETPNGNEGESTEESNTESRNEATTDEKEVAETEVVITPVIEKKRRTKSTDGPSKLRKRRRSSTRLVNQEKGTKLPDEISSDNLAKIGAAKKNNCLLYTSPSPRDS